MLIGFKVSLQMSFGQFLLFRNKFTMPQLFT